MKDDKTEKLLNIIFKAFDVLRESLDAYDAFKIVFVLFHYKHFEEDYEIYANETQKNKDNEQFNDLRTVSQRTINLFDQIYKALSDISAETLGLHFTKVNNCNSNSFDNTQDAKTHLAHIPQTAKREILEIFNSSDLLFKDLSAKGFELVVCMLENKFMQSMRVGNYVSPSLSKLIVKLLNPQTGHYVSDPFCGLGQILITAMDHICDISKPYVDAWVDPNSGRRSEFLMADDCRIELYDKNIEILELAKLRIAAKVHHLFLTGADSNVQDFLVSKLDRNSEASIIFLNPPFGLRQSDNLPSKVNVDGSSLEIPKNHGELFELLHHLQRLSDHGRMSVLIPFGILFRELRVRNIRKFLIENDYVEAIIQLPPNLLTNTSTQTALIVINKNKPKLRKHKTLFAKVEPALEGNTVIISDEEINRVVNTYNKAKGDIEAIVTLEEIQQQDYNLSPELYIGALSKEIKELVETQTGKPLGDICEITKGKRKADNINYSGFPDISTKDLSKDIINYNLNLFNSIRYIDTASNVMPRFVDKKCILVSLIGNELKPTIYNPDYYKDNDDSDIDNSKILLGRHNIVAIIPDEEIVDFEYLYYQLYSPIVKKQFEASIIGAGGIPRITLQNFEKIVIPVLKSIEEQRAFIKQQKSLLLEAENLRHENVKKTLRIVQQEEKTEKEKKQAEFKIASFISHNLNEKIGVLNSIIDKLGVFIENKSLNQEPIQEQFYEGQSVELVDSLINRATYCLEQMTKHITNVRKFVTKEIKEEDFKQVNLEKLFKDKIIPQYSNNDNKNFRVDFKCVLKSEINLCESEFISAIENIINNANVHGFTVPEKDYVISIWINEAENHVQIDCANNGNPLPPEVTKEKLLSPGEKDIESDGSGLGGAYINEMVKAHKGSFAIISDREHSVHFRIILPKGKQI